MDWLDTPQEWRGIPQEPRSPFHGGLLKERLDGIVKAGAAGRPFLLRTEPLDERRNLSRRASNYRRRYGEAGFAFEVREIPGVLSDSGPSGNHGNTRTWRMVPGRVA